MVDIGNTVFITEGSIPLKEAIEQSLKYGDASS